MYKSTRFILALNLIALGGLLFLPGEIKAGQIGQNVPRQCYHRGGETTSAKLWCAVYFDYEQYCDKPESCNGKPVPAIPGTISFPGGKGPGPLPRTSRSAASQPETSFRQTSATLLSLLVLLVGVAGIIWSGRKLLRLEFGSANRQRRRTNRIPAPQIAGLVSLIALAIVGSAAAWLTTRGTHASPASIHSHGANSSPVQSMATAEVEPKFSSAFQIGGAGLNQIAASAVDNQGNIYVAGGFEDAITFNTLPQPTTLNSTEAYDVFVAKYTSAGQALWARVANGATGLSFSDPVSHKTENFSYDGALSLAVDAQGNAYVGGGFVKSLAFKDAAGNTVATLHDNSDPQSDDINFELFVAKYDAAGTLSWARGGESGAPDDGEAEEDLDSGVNGITEIVVDPDGNPYVAGTFSGTSFIGHSVASEGKRDILLSRLDPVSGNPVWVATPGSAEVDATMGLAIDDAANLYMIGDMGGSITFPTQPQPTNLLLADEFRDTFIAKYNAGGQVLWAKQIGGSQPIDGLHIAVNRAGQIYLTGAFEGEANFDSIKVTDPSVGNGSSGFLTKYTTDGNALWVRVFGRSGGEESSDSDVAGYRVAVDTTGAPYVSGIYEQEATFGRETPASARLLLSDRIQDQFIAHYDAAGKFRWVKQPAESGPDTYLQVGSADVPVQVLPMRLLYNDSAKDLILTSDFRSTLGLDDLTLTSSAGRHGYVATLPLAQTAPAGSEVQFSAADYQSVEGASQTQVTVTRSGDTSVAATVDYLTSDGTASQMSDYELSAGTLHFAPGETSKSFPALFVDDAYAESVETINLSLLNPAGTSIGMIGTASISITDNDAATSTTNPIDGPTNFVRQHYLDFLNREPDQEGLNYWTAQLTQCGSDAVCLRQQRIAVSNAFFYEREYQQTGAFVFRLYRAAFGNSQPAPNPDGSNPGEARKLPSYAVFAPDRAQVVGGANLAQSQLDLANAFVQRADFVAKYPASLAGPSFIGAVLATINNDLGVDLSSQQPALLTLFNSGGRGAVLYRLADDNLQTNPINNRALIDAEYNRAFVATQYFGYLRRDADLDGFTFWLGQVNSAPLRDVSKQHALVCSFITATEYQNRFSPVVTHSNGECQ